MLKSQKNAQMLKRINSNRNTQEGKILNAQVPNAQIVMLKCSNAQMHKLLKCPSSQTHKCSNAQMLKCTNCSNAKKMRKCLLIQGVDDGDDDEVDVMVDDDVGSAGSQEDLVGTLEEPRMGTFVCVCVLSTLLVCWFVCCFLSNF